MRKPLPILFLILLLAGILMGLASNSRAQSEEVETKARSVRLLICDGGSFLGVHLEEVTADTVQRLRLPEERGALITQIVPNSPAAQAGLQKDDVIVRWNETPIESAGQLRRYIRETPAGRTVRLGIVRQGREREIKVTLGRRSEHAEPYEWELGQEALKSAREALDLARQALGSGRWDELMVWSYRGRMGVTLQSLTPQLAEYFGLKDRSGALITSVRKDSPADRAGLKAGDIILAIDGETVEDPGDVRRLISKKEEGPVEVRLMRDRHEMSVTVTLEKRERSRIRATPEIEVKLDPSTWPIFRHRFFTPWWGIHSTPFWSWQTPEIQAPSVAPDQRLQVTPGVI